jgi:hypothetical protein
MIILDSVLYKKKSILIIMDNQLQFLTEVVIG